MTTHELTTTQVGQTVPWSDTIVRDTYWRAECSCARWAISCTDPNVIPDRWDEHVARDDAP